MHLSVITNSDREKSEQYKIARAIYAETGGASLRLVEAVASAVLNMSRLSQRTILDITCDTKIFESQNVHSVRHYLLSVDARERAFQMCLRVVQKMMRGNLPDACCGATRFHRADIMPDWATSRGYIAEIDDVLFYL